MEPFKSELKESVLGVTIVTHAIYIKAPMFVSCGYSSVYYPSPLQPKPEGFIMSTHKNLFGMVFIVKERHLRIISN